MDLKKASKITTFGVKMFKFFVSQYDCISYPIYYASQRPWKVLERSNRVRARLEDPNNPYSAWVRTGQLPPHYLDGCRTVPEAQRMSLRMNGSDAKCLGFRQIYSEEDVRKSDGKVVQKWDLSDYQWLTFGEVDERIGSISRGLLMNGIKPKDTVLIFSETRLEWFLSAQAILRIGASITTLYPTLGTDGLIHGINEVEVSHIITTEDLLSKLVSLQNRITKVKKIIYIEMKHKSIPRVEFNGIELVNFGQLENAGRFGPEKMVGVEPTENDIALIQYTSGSTGAPKGVILTHKQIISTLQSIQTLTHNHFSKPQVHSYLAYLPLSHAMEFVSESHLFAMGVKIGYGTPFTLTNAGIALKSGVKGDIILLKPTFMASVPLILDRIRKEIERNVSKKSEFFQQIFNFLINYKIVWQMKGFNTPIINYFICKNIRSQLGGALRFMMCGGAPLNPETQKFLRACLNVNLVQGYGLTETTGAAISMDDEQLSFGHIGSPLYNVKVRLIDWEEGGYRVDDKPNSRGEAVIGLNNVAKGYYKLDAMTDEAFETKDGTHWFKSGDIVEVNSEGIFKIIDRKKDFLKLPFGEYISLGKVEYELMNCPFVDNICIYGNSFHSYLIALIIPNPLELKELSLKLAPNESTDMNDMCNNSQVIDFVHKELQTIGQNVGLNKSEIPLKVKLCPEEWTPINGLVTPALKIRRKNIQNYYQRDIDRLYGQTN